MRHPKASCGAPFPAVHPPHIQSPRGNCAEGQSSTFISIQDRIRIRAQWLRPCRSSATTQILITWFRKLLPQQLFKFCTSILPNPDAVRIAWRLPICSNAVFCRHRTDVPAGFQATPMSSRTSSSPIEFRSRIALTSGLSRKVNRPDFQKARPASSASQSNKVHEISPGA